MRNEEGSSRSESLRRGSSNTCWSRMKDPRIVGVSRAFGRKDRHSKVCTVKGLRDRRVRLSVPTAVQIYDLQERLGLSQPSKVVDWLLHAAKKDIDELPPLPAMLTVLGEKQGFRLGGTSHRFENSLGCPSLDHSFFPGWDSPDLSLSHPPRTASTEEDWHNLSILQLHPQPPLLYHHLGITTTYNFPPPHIESEPARPIHFSLAENQLQSQMSEAKGQGFVQHCHELK